MKSPRKTVFGHKLFPTSEKTNTKIGKREYMQQYMRAYRALDKAEKGDVT